MFMLPVSLCDVNAKFMKFSFSEINRFCISIFMVKMVVVTSEHCCENSKKKVF